MLTVPAAATSPQAISAEVDTAGPAAPRRTGRAADRRRAGTWARLSRAVPPRIQPVNPSGPQPSRVAPPVPVTTSNDRAVKLAMSARSRPSALHSPTRTVFRPSSAMYRPASNATAPPRGGCSSAVPASQSTTAAVSTPAQHRNTVISWGPVRRARGTSLSADFSMPSEVTVVSTWAVPMAAAYRSYGPCPQLARSAVLAPSSVSRKAVRPARSEARRRGPGRQDLCAPASAPGAVLTPAPSARAAPPPSRR